jgi:hypothetical protein
MLVIYNRVVTGNGLAQKPLSRSMRAELSEFAAWCVKWQVDPERYILARHDAVGYRHRIAIGSLASAKFLARFKGFGDDRQAAAMEQDRLALQVEDDHDRGGVELRSLWEQMKRTYALDRPMCRASSDVTGGWNPRSKHCRECPEAPACRAALPEGVRNARG